MMQLLQELFAKLWCVKNKMAATMKCHRLRWRDSGVLKYQEAFLKVMKLEDISVFFSQASPLCQWLSSSLSARPFLCVCLCLPALFFEGPSHTVLVLTLLTSFLTQLPL